MQRTHDAASKKHGPEFEKRVLELLRANDQFRLVRQATKPENREKHFDVYAEMVSGAVLKVECKSIKENNDALVVIEGRTNCDKNGDTHPGWLFGSASHIAFERADGRITWVKMSVLRDYVESRDIDWWTTPTTKKIPGHVYTRTSGREQDTMIAETVICGGLKIVMDTRGDRMVYLPMSEIEELPGAYTA
jgi:hypothetical protein